MRAVPSLTFLVLLLFIIAPLQLSWCRNGHIMQERQALEKLKESFSNNSLFDSWEGDDYCQWKGVGCDVMTGHVVKLALGQNICGCHHTIYFGCMCPLVTDELNSSLLQLKHLNYLDLSATFFRGGKIPTFIGSMKQLTYLNLSYCGFSGNLPHHLGNLSNLHTLDVSEYFFSLYASDVVWLSKLSSLKHLAMNGVSLGKAYNLFQALDMLLFLSRVELHRCELTNMQIPGSRVNSTFLTNVQALNLAQNFLSGPIPNAFQNLTSIRDLNLGHNNLTSVPYWLTSLHALVHLHLFYNPFKRIEASVLSILTNMCSLRTLDLSYSMAVLGGSGLSQGNYSGCKRYELEVLMLRGTKIRDSLPSWFGELENLKSLDLGMNEFYGPIPFSFGNLLALTTLDLSGNLLDGSIPTYIEALSELTALHLSNNQLHGSIPTTLGRLSSLLELDLSSNHLNGSIPDSLGRLSSLGVLDLSNNHLSGSIPKSLEKLANLMILKVANNSLTGTVPKIHLGTHFPLWLQSEEQVSTLDISNNQIGGSIPKDFGHYLPHLYKLNFQNNLIKGSIPDSLCKMEMLFYLDLSTNRLSGEIPNCWGNQAFSILNLASNQLSGAIPSSFGNLSVGWLNLSNNSLQGEPFQALKRIGRLMILDLGVNQLSGEIPSWWVVKTFPILENLRLRQNMFSGDIPTSICHLPYLQILDLADNNFSGSIPPCIGNLKGMVKNAETAPYETALAPIEATLPEAAMLPKEQWDNEGFKQVLKGFEQDYTKTLQYLVNIDLSNNSLIGSIPEGFTSLSGLIGLNLSLNQLSGKIPSNIQQMKSLESIDFSNNHLLGPIPTSMSNMDNLGFLNLSNNNFSGPIPRNDHFLTFDELSFAGNPCLCGEPLKSKCFNGDEMFTATSNRENSSKKEKVLFYFVIALGFITGFWAFFGMLLLKKNWRHAYFCYVDDVADKINSTSGHITQEQQALINFKESFSGSDSMLLSWEGNDYCQWEGVACDGITGHVLKLDLRQTCSLCPVLRASDVNSSILELKQLNYLDLSGIQFDIGPIPAFLGSMKQLRYLNLSYCGFIGKVPPSLGNLSNLQVLDISGYLFSLYADDVGWLSKLSSLKHLAMNGVSLGNAYNLFQVIDKFPFLLQVELCGCGLTNMHIIPSGPVNSTFLANVQVINLALNSLSGPIPDAFRNLTSIRDLNLGYNNLTSVPYWLIDLDSLVHLNISGNPFKRIETSVLSMLTNMCSLQSLDLSYSMVVLGGAGLMSQNGNYSGCRRYNLEVLMLRGSGIKESLPFWIGELVNLKSLDLGMNEFYGPIPLSFGNLLALRTLDLSGNLLNGTIPTSIDAFSELTALRLSDNQLHGSIPTTFGRLFSLRELKLSNNHLNGSIPESIGQLGNLLSLSVANNSLTGIISEIHFSNLSNLIDLQIGFNNLTLKIESNWTPPFNLESLGLASCNIESHFPLWLQTQDQLSTLDISNNQISGSIPKDFGHHLPNLYRLNLQSNLIEGSIPYSLCEMEILFVLDLSENKLSGKIPDCWGGKILSILNLASNKLSGTIPSSFGSLMLGWLNLSNNSLSGEPLLVLKNTQSLQILDLGMNQFTGMIPSWWIVKTFYQLQNLRLRQNLFSGDIPASLCQLPFLRILDLAENNFSGSIPPCIGHLRSMVKNAATTPYESALAPMMEAGAPTVVADEQWGKEDLKQVLKGYELDYTKNLKYLVNIDLSNNSLIGSIPDGLTSLSGLIGLNLAHNHLSGKIPSSIQQMSSLESIDFSNNNLYGPIPTSMSNMDNLGFLNLSNNNFSGPIPRNDHFLTFDEPSFVGNPYLCGEPLKNKCFGGDEVPSSMAHEDNSGNGDQKEKVLFYFVTALGFITGFWAFFGTLLLKKKWRHAYFHYMDEVAGKMYVATMVRVARLKR
ncbi:receptor-like protein EIX1 [Abrus precatorius]|uniref:Receptor-like protein EIX1 n=1 Tax=Abrus precatorius TaxID=3816 RepID=A0A8B8MA74_ABRPR|nr:receptor-like protein EIX1 [Abrus precatorius]